MTMLTALLVSVTTVEIPEDAFGYCSFGKTAGGIGETGNGTMAFFDLMERYPEQESIYIDRVKRVNGMHVSFSHVPREEAMNRLDEIFLEYAEAQELSSKTDGK